MDKRCHMVQRDGQMVIDTVTTVGEVREETKTVCFAQRHTTIHKMHCLEV